MGSGQVVNRSWSWELGPATDTPTDEDRIIYVVGCVYYKDLDEKPFYSDICMIWTPKGGLLACDDPSRNNVG